MPFLQLSRRGVLTIEDRADPDLLLIAIGDRTTLQEAVWVTARLGWDNETWLCPGVREARDDQAAIEAADAYRARVVEHLAAGAAA